MRKIAEPPLAAGSLPSAAPVPEVQVISQFAPGKKGPAGTAPRTNYSKVNSGAPEAPDAGAVEQKSLQPKYGSHMRTAATPTLQDLVSASISGVMSRTKIAEEAKRQADSSDDEKKCEKCGKEKCACGSKTASASSKVSTEYAMKLAGALDYLSDVFSKEATEGGPGVGPGALEVSHATASHPLPDHKGQATPANVVPMHPAEEKGKPGDQSPTAMATNDKSPPGAGGKVPEKVAGIAPMPGTARLGKGSQALTLGGVTNATKSNQNVKILGGGGAPAHPSNGPLVPTTKTVTASVNLLAGNLARFGIKLAEDAINPAQISAGAAVAPEASAAGQPGGEPAGGAPQGPTHAVSSNQAAINLTRGQAYANRKADMKKWLDEPMDSAKHDNTLQVAFDETSKAGPKVASAGVSVKAAAARALIEKMAAAVN